MTVKRPMTGLDFVVLLFAIWGYCHLVLWWGHKRAKGWFDGRPRERD